MGKVELQMKKARESLEAKAKTDNMASEVQTSSYGALLAKERERPHCEWRFIFDPRPLPPVRWFWRNHRTDLHHLLLLHSHHHRTSPVAHPSTTTRRRAHQPVLSLRLSSGHLLRGRMTEPVFYGRTGRLRRDCGQEISDSIGMGKWGYSTTRIWSHSRRGQPLLSGHRLHTCRHPSGKKPARWPTRSWLNVGHLVATRAPSTAYRRGHTHKAEQGLLLGPPFRRLRPGGRI
ncbi:hypothetical protein HDK64DRAFT_276564 [Phyllosticta capitalensis]